MLLYVVSSLDFADFSFRIELRLRLLSPVLYYTVFGEEGGKFDISIEISNRFSFLFRNNYRRFLFRNVIITAISFQGREWRICTRRCAEESNISHRAFC